LPNSATYAFHVSFAACPSSVASCAPRASRQTGAVAARGAQGSWRRRRHRG
jgi:hypothetical protein